MNEEKKNYVSLEKIVQNTDFWNCRTFLDYLELFWISIAFDLYCKKASKDLITD